MFSVCQNCANWHVKREIDPTGPFAICPSCGFKQKFIQLPLFSITGPSGAGKSTLTAVLMHDLPEFVLLEGDIFWRSEFNKPTDNYIDFRNVCLRAAKNINQAGRPTVLAGTSTPGQYEACPEFCYFSEAHYLALVCDDEMLAERLRQRPSWRKSNNDQFITNMVNYNQWFKDNTHIVEPAVTLLDTTNLTVEETAVKVKDWLYGRYPRN